ncbi:hypothetical protein EVAR_12708_1 [Eumeta japonica]|uniref:Uncharacterized protein n=1 Tax=Eumeta variegata TaxID=151549 RepID=A0A4C1UP97_EUMVA|nr:hypothetical protein EVAR_12708_1 [Eumeta japonica]
MCKQFPKLKPLYLLWQPSINERAMKSNSQSMLLRLATVRLRLSPVADQRPRSYEDFSGWALLVSCLTQKKYYDRASTTGPISLVAPSHKWPRLASARKFLAQGREPIR